MERICPQCDQPLPATRAPQAVYCSRRCSALYRYHLTASELSNTHKVCKQCRRQFQLTRQQAYRLVHQPIQFCSRECINDWQADEHQAGRGGIHEANLVNPKMQHYAEVK